MHLYKHFFKLISRNKVGIIIYACIAFVMVTMLVASAKSQAKQPGVSAEVKSYNISFLDEDDSEVSKGLIEYLSKGNKVSDYSGKSETEISNLVFFVMTDYFMNIPDGFGESVEEGDTTEAICFESSNGASGYDAYEINNRINGYLKAYRNLRKIGFSKEEAAKRATEILSRETVMTIVSDKNEKTSVNVKEVVLFNINQYYAYLMLGLMALGVGHTIIITSKKELEDRNCVSPVPTYMTRFVNIIGLISAGTIFWALFMAFNFIYGRGTEMISNFGWVIAVNSFLNMLTCCAIASLLTAFIKNSNTLSMVTNIVGLSMSFFCGVMVPMRFIGEKVLSFSKFLPFYWTILVNNMTSTLQSKAAYDQKLMLTSFGIELLFAIAISTIAIIGNNKCIIKA